MINFLSRLFEEIFPFISYWFRDTKKRNAEDKAIANGVDVSNYNDKDIDWLNETLDASIKDASFLDEKTFKLTLSLALALTFLGTSMSIMVKEISHPIGKVLVAVLVGLSVLYIICGGLIALGAMRTQRTYGKRRDKKIDTIAEISTALSLQDMSNVRRHLRNEAAYQSLRNGLILLVGSIAAFGIFYVLSLWPAAVQSLQDTARP
jgi:hypothetical protein